MYRILHISDLHLVSASVQTQPTVLQRFGATIGAAAGIEVKAEPYSSQTLDALHLAVRDLQPDAIFLTGDITNYGDEDSMQFAKAHIEKMSEHTRGGKVLAVPGNHDTLVERAAVIEKKKTAVGFFVRRLGLLNREIGTLRRLLRRAADTDPIGFIRLALTEHMEQTGALPFLAAYGKYIAPSFGTVDPSQPVALELPWVKAFIFLFNSNVDETFMANEGCIGGDGYNKLHAGLTNDAVRDEITGALKIALLHHHPISAPQALDTSINRYYDWMRDGPRLLQFLNRKGFSLVMHGHQHVPFVCTVNYGDSGGAPLHIVAAGSATQAGEKASFNVVDILNPFQVQVTRYDYDETTFEPAPQPRRLSVRPESSIRLTSPDEPEIAEDGALRNLILATEQDGGHEYELLEYKVTITKNHKYIADYRRKGVVRSKDGENGLVFVITGSPAMKLADLNLNATSADDAHPPCTPVLDAPTRKVVRVLPKRAGVRVGDVFDVTLHFEWHSTDAEPFDFDGFNFMNIRYPIGQFVYELEYEWSAHQICVLEYALDKRSNKGCIAGPRAGSADGFEKLRLEVKPKSVVYLIYFGRNAPPDFWTT